MASQVRLIDTLPPANRQKPMEVLALGFSRTGTMSLKAALEKLGYKVYHMEECVRRHKEQHLLLFEEAVRAKLDGDGKLWTGAELDKVLQNYTVLSDIPCLHFVDELLGYYPNAKVILTVRDIDSWQKSVENTIFAIANMRILPFMSAIDPLLWRPYYYLLKSSVKKWTDGDTSNAKALRSTYTEHYDHVRSKVPPQMLLDFDPRDGWSPLCKFLGKEAPINEPFPRVNQSSSTVYLHYFLIVMRLCQIGFKYIGLAAVISLAYGLSRWVKK